MNNRLLSDKELTTGIATNRSIFLKTRAQLGGGGRGVWTSPLPEDYSG